MDKLDEVNAFIRMRRWLEQTYIRLPCPKCKIEYDMTPEHKDEFLKDGCNICKASSDAKTKSSE